MAVDQKFRVFNINRCFRDGVSVEENIIQSMSGSPLERSGGNAVDHIVLQEDEQNHSWERRKDAGRHEHIRILDCTTFTHRERGACHSSAWLGSYHHLSSTQHPQSAFQPIGSQLSKQDDPWRNDHFDLRLSGSESQVHGNL